VFSQKEASLTEYREKTGFGSTVCIVYIMSKVMYKSRILLVKPQGSELKPVST